MEGWISNKLRREMASIFDADNENLMRKRTLWYKYSEERNKFLNKIREEGLTSKQYSDQVIAWDKVNREPFEKLFNK